MPRTKAPTFNGDPRIVARFQPHIAPPPLCRTGPVIGYDIVTRRPFRMNPWELRTRGIIPATTCRFTGTLGAGKTSAFMILAMRMNEAHAGVDEADRPKDIRGRIEENKHEGRQSAFLKLSKVLEGDLIKVDQANSINPFQYDPGMTEQDMVAYVLRTCLLMNDSESLAPLTSYAFQVAIHKMMERPDLCGPDYLFQLLKYATLEDEKRYSYYVDQRFREDHKAVLSANQEDAEQIMELQNRPAGNISEDEFRYACRDAMLFPDQLMRGDYGGVFGTGTGLTDIARSSMSIIDWFNVPLKTRDIITSRIWQGQTVSNRNPDQEDLNPHFVFTDEAGKAVVNQSILESMAARSKDARAYPTWLVQATQFEVHDLIRVGEADSRARAISQAMEQTIGMRLIGALGKIDEETEHFYGRLGIEPHDLYVLSDLPPGCFGVWVHGQPLRFLQMIPRPMEWEMIPSDSAADSMKQWHGKLWTPEELLSRADAFACRMKEEPVEDNDQEEGE